MCRAETSNQSKFLNKSDLKGEMMLQTKNVTVRRGHRRVLENVDVAVTPGSMLALIGPNGAGKSTLLKVLSGELQQEAGEVNLDGIALQQWKRTELARRRAVLSQGVTLTFGFRVLDIVLMGRRPSFTVDRITDLDIAHATLNAVGMLAYRDCTYQHLSGGEQQRVHLARVLAQVWDRSHDAPYLLLDEPVAGLDPAHQHTLLKRARHCADAGYGVLVVLHDLNLASQYADRVAVLRNGHIVCQDEPETVFTPGRIHNVFGISADVTVHPRTCKPQLVMWH